MILSVITPAAPFVTPADIAGSHAPDDAPVAATIAAVTEELDGPTGWLGRAIGPQTIELRGRTFGAWRELSLPCPPLIGGVVVKYLDADLQEQTFAADQYEVRQRSNSIRLKSSAAWPLYTDDPEAVRIQYQAGYNGTSLASGGTGPIPARVKQAVIVMVQDLIATKAENLFIRSEEVEGIGTRQYTVSDQVGAIIQRTAGRLLTGLRVYA